MSQVSVTGRVIFVSAPKGAIEELLVRREDSENVHIDGSMLSHDPNDLYGRTINATGFRQHKEGAPIIVPETRSMNGQGLITSFPNH